MAFQAYVHMAIVVLLCCLIKQHHAKPLADSLPSAGELAASTLYQVFVLRIYIGLCGDMQAIT